MEGIEKERQLFRIVIFLCKEPDSFQLVGKIINGAYNDEKLLGVIRAVGNGHSVVFIQDILIYPEYQRQGIVTALLKHILQEYKHVYQKHLLTENTEKTIQFYKSLGFIMDTDMECRAFSIYY